MRSDTTRAQPSDGWAALALPLVVLALSALGPGPALGQCRCTHQDEPVFEATFTLQE